MLMFDFFVDMFVLDVDWCLDWFVLFEVDCVLVMLIDEVVWW